MLKVSEFFFLKFVIEYNKQTDIHTYTYNHIDR